MAEREEIPNVEWGQRGDPSGVQRRTVHGESRKKISDAAKARWARWKKAKA